MRKTLHASVAVALVLVGLTASSASAQIPFLIDGSVTDPSNSHASGSALKTADPAGSAKELGPINSSATKVSVIGNALPPMLGSTNQNAQVDLNTIYTETQKAVNGDLWYYFGWSRDSATGSGFISIEFQKAAVDPACDYANKTPDQLIATCNPWKNRQAGDFLLLWDQQGGSTLIIKRVFTGVKPNLVLGQPSVVSTAAAQYSSDGFRGEAAVNLTTDIFTSTGSCQTFANIIPNTVTGNSDTADYKDTVLSSFPPVTNCGTVTVTKSTDPAGLSGTFQYNLAAGGANIFGTGAIDADCSVSGSGNLAACQGTLTTSALVLADSDTVSNLLENGTTWTLGESTPSSDFELKSIDCILGSTSYHLFGAGTVVSSFKVEAGQTTACTIVNKLVKVTPNQTTAQVGYAQIQDTINLTAIRPGASDASGARATFRLYSNDSCSDAGLVYTSGLIALIYGGTPAGSTASATIAAAVTIVPSITYHWRATYSGDAFNNGFTTSCAQETATATFTFAGQ